MCVVLSSGLRRNSYTVIRVRERCHELYATRALQAFDRSRNAARVLVALLRVKAKGLGPRETIPFQFFIVWLHHVPVFPTRYVSRYLTSWVLFK